ncbi:MAG: hypothetical protein HQK83_19085, partial [Fibrobacteria bacterium]|nr:hypothetical protein [Fibrobacteria bacterium]
MPILRTKIFLISLIVSLFTSVFSASPYYFIAIHNEPAPPNLPVDVSVTLKQMVRKADSYNIKLTIMLNSSWEDYISDSIINVWRQDGHEIAAHHHSTIHP